MGLLCAIKWGSDKCVGLGLNDLIDKKKKTCLFSKSRHSGLRNELVLFSRCLFFSVFPVTEKEDSRWWPWMHRLKRIRNNTHTLGDWALAYAPGPCLLQTWLWSTSPTGMYNSCQWKVIFDHFGLGLLMPNKDLCRCMSLIRARQSNNASVVLTAGCETAETRLITRCICNPHLTEHEQARTAKGKWGESRWKCSATDQPR